jgi:hypothetical protein
VLALQAGCCARERWPSRVVYLREPQQRRDDRRTLRRKEALDSGLGEVTYAQKQCPLKRTGQFRSPAGDEALLCVDTFPAQRASPCCSGRAAPR